MTTDNHEYNVPNAGEQDWHIPLNENFEDYDTDIEIRDESSNRSNYTPKAGAKFVATDTEAVYVGDGSSWSRFETSGKSPEFSGMSVGGTGRGLAHFSSPGGEYAVFAESNLDSLGSAIIGVNTGDAGDGIQAVGTNDGRSALAAFAEDDTDYGVLSFGNLGVQGADTTFEVDTSGTIQFDTTESGGSREPMMYMYPDGTSNPEQPVIVHSPPYPDWGLFYNDHNDEFVFRNTDISVDGVASKNFVQSVDTDEGEKEVVYTATESGTPHTEASGVAVMEDGRAEVDLPAHFGWVTSDDEPLHVQTTPHSADSGGLAVVERSTDRIVVEDLDGTGDYECSYTVKGTRAGHEDKQIVREPSAAGTDGPSQAPADD